MADSPAGSDASNESENERQAGGNHKTSTAKDKECQFCHQKFTSSSLGRHLDQFISKKKADGIHDVDAIRKIRAGITRRTARGKKKEDSADNADSQERSAQPSPVAATSEAPTSNFLESLNKSAAGTNDIRFNRLGWQSTGVLTDTPSANTLSTTPVASPTVLNVLAGTKRSFTTYAADLPSSTADNLRALELSLREVLDAVSSATKRAAPLPDPFPFDITTRAFPSLVVALLPTPATLFQSAPFSTPTTIPLKPPGAEHFQALRIVIRDTFDQWKWDALAHIQRTSDQSNMNISEEATHLSERTQVQIDKALRHLDAAYAYYASSPPDQQHHQWTIELLRALKTEQDKTKEANERITRIMQEASQLQQQIDYLSSCQWPREMALWPPERNTFSSSEQKELSKSVGVNTFDVVAGNTISSATSNAANGSTKWEYETLVNKWKRHVREDRARRGTAPNSAASAMLPPGTMLNDHVRAANDASATYGTSSTTPTSATARKPISEAVNGSSHAHGASPTRRSVENTPNASQTERTTNTTNSGLPRPLAGRHPLSIQTTPSSLQQSFQRPSSNVQIISDAEEHYSRFLPYLKQKDLEERQARNSFGD